jgi:hypothetical protein
MLFPVTYTVADAEDILPPGHYRFDLVDGNGEPLDVMVPLTIGGTRSADAMEREGETGSAPGAMGLLTGDVRTVLDANIRAMQMAFLHNQRMLEIGVQLAEVLRDSVHVLATAQADWIKSAISTREMPCSLAWRSDHKPARTATTESGHPFDIESNGHGRQHEDPCAGTGKIPT